MADEEIAPTTAWKKLSDKYYQRREIYDMQGWLERNLDLSKLKVAAAMYGGPIAVTRDRRRWVEERAGDIKGNAIHIYTSAGDEISSFTWSHNSPILQMGWSDQERLVCVSDDAVVFLFGLHGEMVGQFGLSKECREQGLVDALVFGSGLVVLTRAMQLFWLVNMDETSPRVRALAATGLLEAPVSWAVIEPQYSSSHGGSVEVLLATKSGTILVVDTESCRDQLLSNGPFTKMAVSPAGRALAVISSSGRVLVLPSDFSKPLNEFDTKAQVPPQQIVWCGQDAVALYWDRILLLVGPSGWIKYDCFEASYLAAEPDGLRLLSNSKCEFVHRVADVTEDVFRIGSTAPAAMLYDALDHFEKKNPKADENIRCIKAQLAEAVDACVEAAGNEWSVPLQRRLMRAASFGKCFLDNYPPAAFVDMCKTLRVLNAVRKPQVGLPLSHSQLRLLSPEVLVDRLINRHQHFLAWKICEFLKLKRDRVLVHWACVKVTTAADDNSVGDLVVSKLAAVPGISYAEIASTAYKSGRQELAKRLLEVEPRAADQVPLLLSMEADEVALNKAIESGDTDLIYLVILQIKRKKTLPEFLRILAARPVAMGLFVAYARERDLTLLKDIYRQSDQLAEMADLAVLEGYQQPRLEQRLTCLQTAMAMYGEIKDLQHAQKATQEQVRLLMMQHELERDMQGEKFVDTSLSDTLFRLCLMGDQKRVAKFRSEFQVPDKRFWWIRVKAYGQARDWEGLDKFSREKKSPIGYEPFAEVCIEAGATAEALKYIPKIADPATKAEFYVRINQWREAVATAKDAKDRDLMMAVRAKAARAASPEILALIDQLMSMPKW